MEITFEQIEEILDGCLATLIDKDRDLLIHDVSERAVTHKLAEYLQVEVQKLPEPYNDLKVDCEYNRNIEAGNFHPKTWDELTAAARAEIRRLKEEENEEEENDDIIEKLLSNPDSYTAVSTYPDIIIHRRTINPENLLIVEVKKTTSKVSHEHDFEKLSAFTGKYKNPYKYRFGVFVLLVAGKPFEQLKVADEKWYFRDKEDER